ncbi:hypothetical protein [Bacillus sp. CGMCC 1.16541]|uniref:hypothetical protein n=1 Tax=Bacillus sp. CGMCC 1.16541 TaxID=2185143 RepID=UPI000D73F621|nr:hypothetical protein [Bacillus sp. CGMCC 1.16541]
MAGELNKQRENKVISIKRSIQYRFLQEVCKIEKVYPNGNKELKEYVLIMVEQNNEGCKRSIVHPLSEYLLQPSKRGGRLKVNSLSTKASYIVRFLNYVLIENSHVFRVNDVMDLRFEHGVEFLNYYATTGVKRDTVKACENELKQLYYFLAKKNVLKFISLSDFEHGNSKYDSRGIVESPFYGIDYPDDDVDNVLHYLPQELVLIFLDTALTYVPRIALGVYFQFFGGLRVGEVVNISRSSVNLKGPFGKFGIVVNVKNRKFRKDLKHRSSGGAVKKIRKQAIYPYKGNVLEKIYKNHIENYKATDGSNALFVNDDGKAMTDYSYRYHFNKLKEIFIKRLKDSNDATIRNYAIFLKSKKWSTHLGRGVFSNMIAEVATNITQIRQARGDNTFDASMSYLSDTEKMTNELYNNQIDMWEMLIKDVAEHIKEENVE